MKIVSLKAENIKRLVAVEITPKGNVVKITGKNANGKSSVLDSIWMALGGGDTIPGKPIRDSEEKGFIELDLGDMKVTRRFTQKGSTLAVENKDGSIFRSPQGMLNDLIGKLAFDPMAFMRMKPVDQFRQLAEHAGIDFTGVDADRKAAFDERTAVNRNGKAKAAEVDAMELVLDKDAPDEAVSVADLANELTQANTLNNNILMLGQKIKGIESTKIEFIDDIEKIRIALQEAERKLVVVNDDLSDATKEHASLEIIDVTEIQAKINNAEETNKAVTAKQNYNREHAVLTVLRSDSQKLTDEITVCDQKRTDMITEAKLPVEGLSFGDGIVTLNDVPLEQASSAEQLQVSVSVAMAMNPKLRVIRIEDGSLLDSDSMAAIEKMAKSNDFQFWIEQVDETGKVGVVIEDGRVAADNQ